MKKNDDEILRFLSGLMDPDEENVFLKKLESDSYLSNRFHSIKERIDGLSSPGEIEADDFYFNSLVPKVRERLELSEGKGILKKYSIAIPVLVTILIVALLTVLPERNGVEQTISLVDEIVNNIDDVEIADNLINDHTFESVIAQNTNGNGFESLLPDDVSIPQTAINRYVDYSKVDYSQVENLSNPEFEKLYKNLSMITFEKVSK